jgi:hypothetical protein
VCQEACREVCRVVCRKEVQIVNVPQTTQEVLTASNIRIIKNDPVAFDAVTQAGLPDKLFVQGSSYVNCSSQTVTQQISLQVSFQRSAGIQVSQSVTNTQTYTLGAKFTPVTGLDINASVAIGKSATNGTVDTSSWQQTATRGAQTQATMAAKTALYARIAAWPLVYTVPFHTTVLVDADISQNDKGYSKLSDLVDTTKRTFPLKGTMTFTDASDGQITVYDKQFDSSMCKDGDGVLVIPLKPSKKPPKAAKPEVLTLRTADKK